MLAGLGGQLMVLGRLEEGRHVSEDAIAIARKVGATRAEYVAMNTLGTIIYTTEDVDAGLALVGEALEMARANDDALGQMRGDRNLFANSFSAANMERGVGQVPGRRRKLFLASVKDIWYRSSRSRPRTVWCDSGAGMKQSGWSRTPGFDSAPERSRSGCPNSTSLAGTLGRHATTSKATPWSSRL